jgi:SMC interacting uncharacterized protein involved in chromosome segregation
MKHLILLLTLVLISAPSYVGAQDVRSHKEKFETTYKRTKALVEAQTFQFVGNLVYMGGKREKLEPNLNTIRINKSKISGKVVSLSEINKTFHITGEIEQYNVSYNDNNQRISIEFIVEDNTVKININPNGQAVVTYNVEDARDMTWIGKLVKL